MKRIVFLITAPIGSIINGHKVDNLNYIFITYVTSRQLVRHNFLKELAKNTYRTKVDNISVEITCKYITDVEKGKLEKFQNGFLGCEQFVQNLLTTGKVGLLKSLRQNKSLKDIL